MKRWGWIAVLGLAGIVSAQETLRWKFEPGQTFAYRIFTETTSRIEARDKDSRKTETLETVWKVKTVDAEGKAVLEVRFTRVRYEGGSYSYDSAGNTSPKGGMFLRRMVSTFDRMRKARFEVEADRRGVVRYDRRLESQGMRYMIRQALDLGVVLPAAPSARWKETVPSTMGNAIEVHEYVLEGFHKKDGRRQARIDFTIRAPGASEEKQPDRELKHLDGRGTAWFDPEEGRLVTLQCERNSVNTITLMGPTIERKSREKVTITRIPVPAEKSEPTEKKEADPEKNESR